MFSLVKMVSFRSITEVVLLTRNSHSSPIMVFTVTVMNIVMTAPVLTNTIKYFLFVKMDLL